MEDGGFNRGGSLCVEGLVANGGENSGWNEWLANGGEVTLNFVNWKVVIVS